MSDPAARAGNGPARVRRGRSRHACLCRCRCRCRPCVESVPGWRGSPQTSQACYGVRPRQPAMTFARLRRAVVLTEKSLTHVSRFRAVKTPSLREEPVADRDAIRPDNLVPFVREILVSDLC